MPSVGKGPGLTGDEVQSFASDGYVICRRRLFDDRQLDELEDIFTSLRTTRSDKLGDEFDTPHFDEPRLFAFLLADQVLDLVEGLLGPDLLLWSSHFIAKDPGVGRATPWHEDSAYWEGRLDRYDKLATVWLAVDRSDRDNGCMQVIPGSHLWGGFSEYRPVDRRGHTFGREIVDLDVGRAAPLELERGQCSVHDGRIVHGATANRSDRRRLGYTMRYLAADVHLHPEANGNHRVWLARGRNVAGNRCENA